MEKKAVRVAYGEALVKLGETNEKVVVLDADLANATMTNAFKKAFPGRFKNDPAAFRRAHLLIRIDDGAQPHLFRIQFRKHLFQGIEHDDDAALHVDDTAAHGLPVPDFLKGHIHVPGKHGIHVSHEHELL